MVHEILLIDKFVGDNLQQSTESGCQLLLQQFYWQQQLLNMKAGTRALITPLHTLYVP